MKESHDKVLPLKIGSSAYSLKNKETLIEEKKQEEKMVRVGYKPRNLVSSE